MGMKFHYISSKDEYVRKQMEIVRGTEGEQETIYLDSEFIPTVGWGFNLSQPSVVKLLFSKLLKNKDLRDYGSDLDAFVSIAGSASNLKAQGKSKSESEKIIITKLDDQYKKIMKKAGENVGKLTLKHLSNQDMEDIVTKLCKTFEDQLSKELPTLFPSLSSAEQNLYSYERLALISLAYNGGNGLIGPGLKQALTDGDRFKAWYEIRYNSNASEDAGLYKRRFYEANLFGLYDEEDNPTKEEYQNIINWLRNPTKFGKTTILEKITNVENRLDYGKDSKSSFPAVDAARRDYASLEKADSIPYISKAFLPLVKFILADYLPEGSKAKEEITADMITGQVILGLENRENEIAIRKHPAEGQGMNLLVNITHKQDAKFVGGSGRDVILGGDYADIVETGEGDDYLVGGKGKDSLNGGAGCDTYYTDLQDTIEDSDGMGKVYLENTLLTGGKLNPEKGSNVYTNGNIIYTLSGSVLTIKYDSDNNSGSNDGALKIKSFTNGNLGIYLDDGKNPKPEEVGACPTTDDAAKTTSPLVLDLNGDGIQTSRLLDMGASGNTVYFDLDNSGFAERTGWLNSEDGFLAIDVNGNGKIDSGAELLGNHTPLADGRLAKDGFDALAQYDLNADLVIDAKDLLWGNLLVWQDKNGNGKTEEGELLRLDEIGISAIHLNAQVVNETDAADNQVSHRSHVVWADGRETAVEDVWFRVNTADSRYSGEVNISAEVALLPNVRGFGNVADLHIAMSQDSQLKAMVEAYVKASVSEREPLLDALIYRWTGSEDVDPHSRDPKKIYGHVMDARQLVSLEHLTGHGYLGTWCWGEKDPNPHGNAAPKLIAEYQKFAAHVRAMIADQADYGGVLSPKVLDIDSLTGKKVYFWTEIDKALLQAYQNSDAEQLIYLFKHLQDIATYYPDYAQAVEEHIQELAMLHGDAFEALLNERNYRQGTQKNDYLSGTDRNEFFDGKEGDDNLQGGKGNDIYRFNGQFGNDRIYDREGIDTIIFADADIRPDNIRISRDVTNVYIHTDKGRIQINNFYNFDGKVYEGRIEKVQFANGSVLTWEQLIDRLAPQPTEAADHLYYSEAADRIFALAGNDEIHTGDGNNYVEVGAGDDRVYGGNDQDHILGGAGADVIQGSHGDDVLSGGEDNDRLFGENGDDQLSGDAGDDQLFGGYGDDVLNGGEGNDRLHGENGNDQLSGDAGDDQLSGDYGDDVLSGGEGKDSLWGGAGNDRLSGDAGDDQLNGNDGDDVLSGNAGNDSLHGGSGDDVLSGGEGNDRLDGYDGDDQLSGDAGDDQLEGGKGDDTLMGGQGDDRLSGGLGNDVYVYRRGDGRDTIRKSYHEQGEHDVLRFEDIASHEVRATRQNDDLLLHLADRQIIEVKDYFVGHAKNDDVLQEIVFADGVHLGVNELKRLVQQSSAQHDWLYGYEQDDVLSGAAGHDHLYGNEGNDRLSGDAGNDSLYGGNGDDVLSGGEDSDDLYGEEGNDQLSGDVGNDYLNGGSGDDTLVGGQGYDRLSGGLGNDVYVYRRGDGHDTIVKSEHAQGERDVLRFEDIASHEVRVTRRYFDLILSLADEAIMTVESYFIDHAKRDDILQEIVFADGVRWGVNELKRLAQQSSAQDDWLYGYEQDDVLAGAAGNDRLYGNEGNDRLSGDAGDDQLEGGSGDDRLSGGEDSDLLYGNEGNDQLSGDVGNDSLHGGSGDDVLSGGDGDDRLYGDEGNDQLSGDVGNDSLHGGSGDDVLSGGEGGDRLQGDAGNDQLSGGEGDDILLGGDGDDVIDAGTGNDLLVGGSYVLDKTTKSQLLDLNEAYFDSEYAQKHIQLSGKGSDTYRFGKGDGEDYILEKDASEAVDSILFKADIHFEALEIRRVKNDLVISVRNTEDKLIVKHQFKDEGLNPNWGIEKLLFESDPNLVIDLRESLAVLTQTSQFADHIEGKNLVLHAQAGDDVITTEGDSEVYGDEGNDVLTMSYSNGEVKFYGGDGNDKLIGNGKLYGEAGDDELYGGGLLDGGAGNDYLSGNGELHGGDGNDELHGSGKLDGGEGDDKIEGQGMLDGGVGDDQIKGKGTLIGGVGNDRLTGTGELSGGEGNDHLSITFSEIDYFLGIYDEEKSVLDGGEGDDFIDASSTQRMPFGENGIGTQLPEVSEAMHILRGGKGNDTIYGSFDHDVYEYSLGDGKDIIYETKLDQAYTNVAASYDIIRFSEDIAVADIQLIHEGDDLILAHRNGTDSITIKNHFNAYNSAAAHYKIDAIHFSDGTILDLTAITEQAAWRGSDRADQMIGGAGGETIYAGAGDDKIFAQAGNDRIYGEAGKDYLDAGEGDDYLDGGDGNDQLIGGRGNDRLDGGKGDDNYVYQLGDGQDIIDQSGGGRDVLFFKGGISKNRLSFYREGQDLLIVVDNDRAQSVQVKGHFASQEKMIELVQPDGGYSISIASIHQLIKSGKSHFGGAGRAAFASRAMHIAEEDNMAMENNSPLFAKKESNLESLSTSAQYHVEKMSYSITANTVHRDLLADMEMTH